MGVEQAGGALVPATPEALLRLILTLEGPEVEPVHITKIKKEKKPSDKEEVSDRGLSIPWKTVAITSVVWLAALAVLGASLTSQLRQQDQRLQQIIERLDTRPKTVQP